MQIKSSYDENEKIIRSMLAEVKRKNKKAGVKLKDSPPLYKETSKTIRLHKNNFFISGKSLSSIFWEGRTSILLKIKEAKTKKAKRRILRKVFTERPELLI